MEVVGWVLFGSPDLCTGVELSRVYQLKFFLLKFRFLSNFCFIALLDISRSRYFGLIQFKGCFEVSFSFFPLTVYPFYLFCKIFLNLCQEFPYFKLQIFYLNPIRVGLFLAHWTVGEGQILPSQKK